MTGSVLITGCAGFIGFHISRQLLERGWTVVGLDSLNDYYDPALKAGRLAGLTGRAGFSFVRMDVGQAEDLARLMDDRSIHIVVHLAAQAGVRYSLEQPRAYVDANLVGFANILEACRGRDIGHLIYASSSSVYGANTSLPFRATDNVDHPLNLYAATKRANEAMAHSYAHLFGIPSTGLRFFTVYGPWGRPDMAVSIFAEALMTGQPIRLFNQGRMWRDYTYIDDVVEAVMRLLDKPPRGDSTWSGELPDPSGSAAPWRILNIGHGQPVEMARIVRLLEDHLGRKAELVFEPMQPGEAHITFADVEPLSALIGYRPATTIEVGIREFSMWFRDWKGLAQAYPRARPS